MLKQEFFLIFLKRHANIQLVALLHRLVHAGGFVSGWSTSWINIVVLFILFHLNWFRFHLSNYLLVFHENLILLCFKRIFPFSVGQLEILLAVNGWSMGSLRMHVFVMLLRCWTDAFIVSILLVIIHLYVALFHLVPYIAQVDLLARATVHGLILIP